jgi:hypothetical protein
MRCLTNIEDSIANNPKNQNWVVQWPDVLKQYHVPWYECRGVGYLPDTVVIMLEDHCNPYTTPVGIYIPDDGQYYLANTGGPGYGAPSGNLMRLPIYLDSRSQSWFWARPADYVGGTPNYKTPSQLVTAWVAHTWKIAAQAAAGGDMNPTDCMEYQTHDGFWIRVSVHLRMYTLLQVPSTWWSTIGNVIAQAMNTQQLAFIRIYNTDYTGSSTLKITDAWVRICDSSKFSNCDTNDCPAES